MTSVYPTNEPALFHNISSKSINSKPSTSDSNGTQVSPDVYISRLLTFKSIFGISYLGKYFYEHHNSRSRPVLIIALILYDILSTAGMIYLDYHAFNEYIYERVFRHSYKKLTMNVLFRSSGYCIIMEFLCIKLLTLCRGPKVINTISSIGQGMTLNSGSLSRYYVVYLVIIAEAVMSSVAFVLMFKPIHANEPVMKRCLYSTFYGLEGLIYGAVKSCICSLHMYTSILICQRISEYNKQLQACPNFGLMLDNMLQLKHRLNELNDQLSLAVLITLVTNGILLSSCVCAFEDKLHDKVLDIESLVALSLLFATQLVDATVSCFSSQVIANQMENLIRAIQEMTAQQCTMFLQTTNSSNQAGSIYATKDNGVSCFRTVEDIEYRCLQHICSMKDFFCYNVLGMFDLRNVTVLVILSNVCNYSVLLIQTSETDN